VKSDLRIGLGIDTHRLAPGRPCILGGISIPSPVGPDAHSDGDAILHAACDACLGAAGLDDLGTLFPDSDPANKDRDSTEFCTHIRQLLEQHSLRIQNLDIVLEAEQPRIAPHRAAMRARIAELFGTSPEHINVKGKSAEKLDAIGQGVALRATAIVLLAAT
jgi:2-C-methyl-D-erythritol 2,4-cyclodiphosphate synthase